MRRRLVLLAALLTPVSAQAQSDNRETSSSRKKATGREKGATSGSGASGGASMRGQSTRPGLRAGYAYRHEREKMKHRHGE